MKNMMKKVLASVIVVAMAFAMTVTTNAEGDTQDQITYTCDASHLYDETGEDAGHFILNVHIHYLNSDGTVQLQLGDYLIDAVTKYAEQYGYKAYPIMPGDLNKFRINIINDSGTPIQYENNSLELKGLKMSGNLISGTTTFDGQEVAAKYCSHMTFTLGCIRALYNNRNQSSISLEEAANLYSILKAKGYTSLTQFYLNYYNDKYGTNAAHILDLNDDARFSLETQLDNPYKLFDSVNDRSNGYFTAYYDTTKYATADDYIAYLDQTYPFFNQAAVISQKNNAKHYIQVSFMELEPELAGLSYQYFYEKCFMVGIGQSLDYDNMSTNNVTMGVANYQKKEGTVYTKANKNMTDSLAGLAQGDANANVSLEMGINGPLTTNTYMDYPYGFRMSVTFKKALADVTVTKNLDIGDYDTTDKPTFLFELTDKNGVVYTKAIIFDDLTTTKKSVVFKNLPFGHYSVKEIGSIRYTAEGDTEKSGTLSEDTAVEFTNRKTKDTDFSDNNIATNHVSVKDGKIVISKDVDNKDPQKDSPKVN